MVNVTLTALRATFDAIAPPRCAGCGRPGAELCEACSAVIGRRSLRVRVADLDVRALGAHDGPLRAAIHALKYRNRRAIASMLGNRLGEVLLRCGDARHMLVPVPLHPGRLRERGYNQADLIARAMLTKLPGSQLADRALVRLRATEPQSKLDHAARERNLNNAFGPGSDDRVVTGKNVVLVDDVVTTGATLRSCAAALAHCGPASISAAALAIRS